MNASSLAKQFRDASGFIYVIEKELHGLEEVGGGGGRLLGECVWGGVLEEVPGGGGGAWRRCQEAGKGLKEVRREGEGGCGRVLQPWISWLQPWNSWLPLP